MTHTATICAAFGRLGPQLIGELDLCRHKVVILSEIAVTRRRDPFFMALDSLRTRSEQGDYAPGSPVVISEEARRLSLSNTPVRESLVWLCGYGLLERSPMGGFLAPRLDPAVVRDRYAFRLQCVLISLTDAGRTQGREQGLNGSGQADLGALDHMLRAVRSTGNAALVDAYLRVNAQLVQLAPAERRLFKDIDDEEARLVALFGSPSGDGLPSALAAYHRRRIEAGPMLILEAEAARGAPRPAD